jgi:hypothetical protein
MPPRVQAGIGDYLAARAHHIRTGQFGDRDASQGVTDAADAKQQIAFAARILVDFQCDGLVERFKLAGEVLDRRIGQGMSRSIGHAAVLAILPFRHTGDDAGSNRLQVTQPPLRSEGGAQNAPGSGIRKSNTRTRRAPPRQFALKCIFHRER